MSKIELAQVASVINARHLGDNIAFEGAAIDSRQVQAGNLFVAFQGAHVDGHDFVKKAQDQGAVACLVQRQVECQVPQLIVSDVSQAMGDLARWYWQQNSIKTVGVTGSNGKTTTKNLLGHVIGAGFSCLVTQGNLNNHIGVPLTLLRHQSETHAVIEMGANHQGEIDNLAGIVRPNIGIISNIGPAHLEGFGGMDGVFKGKTELFRHIADDGLGLFNSDTHGIEKLNTVKATAPIQTFGQAAAADYRIEDLKLSRQGCATFIITCFDKRYPVELNILGRHNAWNATSVFAACLALGLDADWVIEKLQAYRGLPGRLEMLAGIRGSCIINDSYNANLGSFEAAIDLLANFAGEKLVVMGEMGELGDAEEAHHAAVGSKAKSAGVTKLLAVGEKTRPAVEAFGRGAQFYTSQEALVNDLEKHLSESSTVLVKGSRSARMEQILPTITLTEEEKRK